jgi:hypothetical protein
MLVVISKRGLLSILTTAGWLRPEVPPAFTSNPYCVPANSRVGFDSGAVWAQCKTTVTSSDGRSWTSAHLAQEGMLVMGPGGRAAIVSAQHVTILGTGASAVTYTPHAALKMDTFPSSAATFTSDGTLWLGGQTSGRGVQLVSFREGQWQRYGATGVELNLKGSDKLGRLAAGPDGTLWAASQNQLFRWTGSQFQVVVDDRRFALEYKSSVFTGQINDLLPQPSGDIWLATSEGIYIWSAGNLTLLDRGDGLPAKDVRGLARDERGRIWAATAYGLALFDGGKWQVIEAASSGLADSDLVALAVRGAPDVPAPISPPKTTTITGRIMSGGKPLANARVILCDEGPGANHRHGEPLVCAEQYYTREAKSDDNGYYRFENVPIGAYTIATQAHDTWYFSIRLPENDWQPIVALKPGHETRMDMGVP